MAVGVVSREDPEQRHAHRKPPEQLQHPALLVAVLEQFGRFIAPPIATSLNVVALALVLFTVGLTLWSGVAYFAKNWDLVSDM